MKKEPHFVISACSYCGDAPVNHTFFYFENLVSSVLDDHIRRVVRYAPSIIQRFADWLPVFIFNTFVFFGLAKYSPDLEKVKTFRSRVIWEEARRRGIEMEQLILWGKPLDHYRAKVKDIWIYFESIPIPDSFSNSPGKNWDDKFALKEELKKENLPTPHCVSFSDFSSKNLKNIFSNLKKPLIVKPKVGSRGRHTITNINTLEDFEKAVHLARVLSPVLVAEEHLQGYVCRATMVKGELVGFYRGAAPAVVGDGVKNIKELIEDYDKKRPERVERVNIGKELEDHVARNGFKLNDILPKGIELSLSHRVGRLFGGRTIEMIDDLHPSFVPVLESAARRVNLFVAGFDCIIPDPTADASSQRWGIIECNTLPFIDLHYYALEGRPRNIAGLIWDEWPT